MDSKFNPSNKYARHPKAHPNGGIHLKDQAAKVKEIGLNLLKTMGVKIKEEGVFDLLKISRPAIVSSPRTFLECVGIDYYFHEFLNKAAAAKDPVERLQWVVCFAISGIHRNPVLLQNNGPLNPVLGETYIAEKKDGTSLYCEQISHHPPVTSYLMVGPNNSYRMYGTGEFEVKLKGLFHHIIGKRLGKNTLEFQDGTKIVFTNPETRIDGLLVGDRRYNFVETCVFLDKRHKISAEANFLFESHGTVSKISTGIKKLFGGSKDVKHPSDEVEMVFFNYDKQQDGEAKKQVICEGTGSWVSHLQVNNKVLWSVDECPGEEWIESMDNNKRLPSDSLFREDSKYIKIKDFDRAQKEKDNLENRQRNDAKLRKEYADRHKGRVQSNMEFQH